MVRRSSFRCLFIVAITSMASCGSGGSATVTATSTSTSTSAAATSTAAAGPGAAPAADEPSAARPCGRDVDPPAAYEHVVLLVEENRTWTGGRTAGVGLGFSATEMPFLHDLAEQCTYYTDWVETDPTQSSLTQYIGLTSGVSNRHTVGDCAPSDSCRSTDDNIFRQVRASGGTARTFVDGAHEPCSVGDNRAKHIPALYYRGGDDPNHCEDEVLPLDRLDPDHLPTFAFVVPDQCHDGHDCSDADVDAWAGQTLTPILDGADYRAGKTLVVVIYDEDRPVPNLLVASTAASGSVDRVTGSHAALLKTIEEVLGLPVMDQGQLPDAVSLRSSAHI